MIKYCDNFKKSQTSELSKFKKLRNDLLNRFWTKLTFVSDN